MSTEIKNTLFRFVTMRAPELLEKESVNQLFALHPENEKASTATFDSAFLQAANHITAGISKRKSLSNAANAFAPNTFKTREALYESNLITKEHYDFAMWLTKNRTTLTSKEIEKRIFFEFSGPTLNFKPLDHNALNQLWDNLFYQIITNKSAYVREAILSVLVADFFVKKYLKADKTNEALRKLAQARIVIPKVLFEKEEVAATKEAAKQVLDALPISTKELDKTLDLLVIEQEIASQKVMIDELKKAKTAYNKTNEKAYVAARKRYEATVANLYANAEKVERTIVDPITNQEKIVIEFVGLEIPNFEFEKAPELQANLLSSKISQKTTLAVNKLITTNEFETFDEVITSLEESVAEATQYLFENSVTEETVMSANGIVLPVVNTIASPSFSVSSNFTADSSILTFAFSDSIENTDIVAADYTITFDDETIVSESSFSDAIVNNKLIVKTFLNGLDFIDKTSFEIKGKFTRCNGTYIDFSGNGTISRKAIVMGIGKTFPSNTSNMYRLQGNGKYVLKSILNDGQGDTGSGSSGNGNNSSNNGSVIDYIPSGFGIKQVGILDYRKVEQEICCYVPGEVSHIENIMAGEFKDRSTKSLFRSETTDTFSKETETEKLTDTTTSNRFEMNQEVASVLAEDTHFGTNANFNSSWSGPGDTKFGLTVGADFATNTTREESNSQAVTMAKEVTERALDRMVLKTKEERVVKITNEFEETNSHGVDNRKNPNHISGVYRWVDKVYRNKVVNYGKRLMYEFMIPEPAAFHNLAATITNSTGESLIKPIDPREANEKIVLKLDSNFEFRYKYWAEYYNALIDSMPEKTISIGKGIEFSNDNHSKTGSKSDRITLPEGYVSTSCSVDTSYTCSGYTGWSRQIYVTFGNNGKWIDGLYGPGKVQESVKPYKNEFPISAGYTSMHIALVNFSVTCNVTKEFIEAWQIKTFNAIIAAYEQKLAEYNQKLKQLRSEIKGTNPGFYRQIENTVLRKNCIEYLNSHDLVGKNGLTTGGTATDFHVNYDSKALEIYAARVKFFEQAFEWNNMSYNFYPMYWGEKTKWQQKYNVEEFNDPIFRAFLQSGMARVMVTVRPGFEEAVNWYMNTGQIWNGGQVPTVNDPLFLSIVEELRNTKGEVEETWETRVPTSLTIIQAGSAGLEVNQALPCDEDCEDNMLFDSDGNPIGKDNPFKLKTTTGDTLDSETPPVVVYQQTLELASSKNSESL